MDSDAEAALRVIDYFDALSMRSATAEMVVRGAAAISEAAAGLRLPDGTTIRFDATGARLSGTADRAKHLAYSAGDVHAWIERDGPQQALDELVLERFALTATSAALQNAPIATFELSDPSFLEVVLSVSEPLAERSVALRRLGLSPDSELLVLAIAGEAPGSVTEDRLGELLRRSRSLGTARAAQLGPLGAIAIQTQSFADHTEAALAVEITLGESRGGEQISFRCGIGSTVKGLDAAASWDSARTALRFARWQSNGASFADSDKLGAIAALAHVASDRWTADWRVRSLRELTETISGKTDLEVLESYLTHGSLRMAGNSLHMHHSSVAARLARLEEKLHLNFSMPADVFQARLCLYAAALVEHPHE